MTVLPRAAEPGTTYDNSTGETQVLGEVVYGAVGGPLSDYRRADLEVVWNGGGRQLVVARLP